MFASNVTVSSRRFRRLAAAGFSVWAFLFPLVGASHAQIRLSADGRIGNHRPADDQVGFLDEMPSRLVDAEFFVSAREISFDEWTTVRNWAAANGYADLPPGAAGVGGTTNTNFLLGYADESATASGEVIEVILK